VGEQLAGNLGLIAWLCIRLVQRPMVDYMARHSQQVPVTPLHRCWEPWQCLQRSTFPVAGG